MDGQPPGYSKASRFRPAVSPAERAGRLCFVRRSAAGARCRVKFLTSRKIFDGEPRLRPASAACFAKLPWPRTCTERRRVIAMSPKPKSVPTSTASPPASGPPAAIDRFSDVVVTVEARLEERLMDFASLKNVAPGVVMPLRRPAGDTLDVYVDNVRFASAEVVVIEDRLALRITEIEGLES